MWIFRRINTLWQHVLNICHYDTCASESRPERVRLCVHTTGPTGPVPEPFHCDHIARWSARSGTTGRSGTGVNTGARLRSGTVPVPKLWCEHGLSDQFSDIPPTIGSVRCIIIPIDGDCALGFRCVEFTSCSMADEQFASSVYARN